MMLRQLELLNGDEFYDPRAEMQSIVAGFAENVPDEYPNPHADKSSWGPNPIATSRAREHYANVSADTQFGDPEETWLPSYEIESPQHTVNTQSIRHMAEHSSGIDVPNINTYQFGDTMMVGDGNHRVNAALERGQMLVPANLRKAY